MAKKTIPPLHIALGYAAVTDADLVTQALAAHDGVKAHPELFPNAPGDRRYHGCSAIGLVPTAIRNGGSSFVCTGELGRWQRRADIFQAAPLVEAFITPSVENPRNKPISVGF
jgi:hypothetical protein